MANYYTSFEKVRDLITKCDAPYEPNLEQGETPFDLKSITLRFLHQRCVGLRFDADRDEEYVNRNYTGKSRAHTKIPYNMERDVERLCLERSLGDFLDSGTREDAYTVYYCFLEMFLNGYTHSKRTIELLSEYELNGSSLLMKHRDHFVHSVYVFALGLALYQSNDTYRKTFESYYLLDEDGKQIEQKAAHLFLELWGLCALFHDIGYPFELAFEMIMSYCEYGDSSKPKTSGKKRRADIYPAYFGVEKLTHLDEPICERLNALYRSDFQSLDELLAHDIVAKLGPDYALDEAKLTKTIKQKPSSPKNNKYYMDHAYFSSCLLFRCMTDSMDAGRLNKGHVDVLSAILLHNSLFQHHIRKRKNRALSMGKHPLAFLLMLCDELQCWDRTAYGRNSRQVQYPVDADLDFSAGSISLNYLFSAEVGERILTYKLFTMSEPSESIQLDPSLRVYRKLQNEGRIFLDGIFENLDCSALQFSIKVDFQQWGEAENYSYLSNSSFLHLYDLAVILHTMNHNELKIEDREKYYCQQSLEYQLSGINRAKAFARYLDRIGCFYSDRLICNKEVRYLTEEELETIAPLEHGRWMEEHRKMGWHRFAAKDRAPLDISKRELLRCHPLMMENTEGKKLNETEVKAHYDQLPNKEKRKDKLPFANLKMLLKEQDGVRIYRMRL